MFIERSLQFTSAQNDELFASSNETAQAIKFMKKHPLAKIVVIVDTHAAENGFFVWVGDTPDDYRACSLLEVGVMIHSISFISHCPDRSFKTAVRRKYSSTFPMQRILQPTTTSPLL